MHAIKDNKQALALKDYLHYYPKCPIVIIEAEGIPPVPHYLEGIDWYNDAAPVVAERVKWAWHQIKPVLRKPDSVTDTELDEWVALFYKNYTDADTMRVVAKSIIELGGKYSTTQFTWLLSKYFDLFGLIDAGLAIDEKTMPLKE